MLLIKSTLLSISAMLVSATSIYSPPPAEAVAIDYCYSVTVTLNVPGGGPGLSVEVSACGNTPSEGLFNLGAAVRHAYNNQGHQQ